MTIEKNSVLELFSYLLAIPSPSGWESAMAAAIRARLSELGYQPETDPAGNVLVRLPGLNPQGPLVCYAAHMDEIGMVVHRIESDGTLRVERLGGLFPWKLGENPVTVLGDYRSITGVLSMGSGHGAGDKSIAWGDTHIITGLPVDALVAAGVRPGSPAVAAAGGRGPLLFGDERDPLVAAWTFDDRMGVVALLRLLELLVEPAQQPASPTLIAFTVQEEIGGMGAKAVAQREHPEVFIAVDGCPVLPDSPLMLDGRPGIWTHDRLAPYDPRLIRDLGEAAELAVLHCSLSRTM